MSDSERLLMTVTEAASRLRIGRTSMYSLLLSGDIVSVTIGRSRRVPVEAIENYVRRKSAEQGSGSPGAAGGAGAAR